MISLNLSHPESYKAIVTVTILMISLIVAISQTTVITYSPNSSLIQTNVGIIDNNIIENYNQIHFFNETFWTSNRIVLTVNTGNSPYPIINSSCIFVPIAGTSGLSQVSYNDVWTLPKNPSQYINGFSFLGYMDGSDVQTTNNTSDQIAIFAASDTKSYNGSEYGFVVYFGNDSYISKTNEIYGYVQDSKYFTAIDLHMSGSTAVHLFTVTVNSNNDFNWFIDGRLVGSISHLPLSTVFVSKPMTVVGTTHRNENNWVAPDTDGLRIDDFYFLN